MSFNPFTDHPETVGESYFQHMRSAAGFGYRMVVAGFACLLHAVLPFVFTTVGSNQIRLLHQRMVEHRQGKAGIGPAP